MDGLTRIWAYGQWALVAGLLLDSFLQSIVDAMIDQIKEADLAGRMAKVGQKSRFFSRIGVAGKIENRQSRCVHCVLRRRHSGSCVYSYSGFGDNNSAW